MKAVVFAVVFLIVHAGTAALGQQGFKVTPVFKGTATMAGQKLDHLRTDKPEVTSVLIEIEPGGEIGRHMHLVSGYVHVLEGMVTIEMDDGTRHEFQAGKAFLEATNMWHNAKNMGKAPVKLLVVTSGEEGKSNLIRPEKK
ncbi:MAG TPA: cupin domain-containing protein [Candidatus Manganitrophaceae bacterium]|nr:cupin domain-containing protein [Candidatus Manganitrophaceae bacterium]